MAVHVSQHAPNLTSYLFYSCLTSPPSLPLHPRYSVTERRSEGPSRAPHPLDKPFGTFSSFPPPTRNDTMPPKYRIEVTCPKHFYTSLFGKKHAVPVNIRVYENSTKRLATYVHVHGCTGVCGAVCVVRGRAPSGSGSGGGSDGGSGSVQWYRVDPYLTPPPPPPRSVLLSLRPPPQLAQVPLNNARHLPRLRRRQEVVPAEDDGEQGRDGPPADVRGCPLQGARREGGVHDAYQ